MEKKYQVFISSTYKDLIEERQKVVEAILNAGHIPAGMELFKSGPKQEDTIREWIQQSDIYVLILGARYGTLNSEGISYTHWEYNLAKELGKPMFSLVLTEDYINSALKEERLKVNDIERSNQHYVAFENEVTSSLVSFIDHVAEIKSSVSDSIREIEKRFPNKLEGWIKGSYLKEIYELRQNNQKLANDLVNRQAEVIDMQKEMQEIKDDYIGSFKFKYVKEELNSVSVDINFVNESIQKLHDYIKHAQVGIDTKNFYDQIDRIEYLKEVTVLDCLLLCKDDLFTEGLTIMNYNKYHQVLNKFFISKWDQYSLVIRTTLTETSYGGSSTSYDKVTLSENGKKFISMIEMGL